MIGIRNIAAATALASCMFVVSGCSSEPSAKDMREAAYGNAAFRDVLRPVVQRELRSQNVKSIYIILQNATLEKFECARAQAAPGFVCDFRWGWRTPEGIMRHDERRRGRFFRSDDGWAVELVKS